MDKIKRNNAIYIAFLSISIAIMAVIIIIPMVQSMRYMRHTVDYNSIVAMGSYHIKISNATYLKDKKELYFALSAKEESNYSGSISSKPGTGTPAVCPLRPTNTHTAPPSAAIIKNTYNLTSIVKNSTTNVFASSLELIMRPFHNGNR